MSEPVRRAVEKPEVHPEWLFGRQPKAIEAQEKAGQSSFVASDTLPAKGIESVVPLGVKVLGPVPGDDLFVFVELPAGWSRRATDHHMWSSVVDAEGRDRISVFYKAAFYDRRAFCRPAQVADPASAALAEASP